MAEPRRWRPSLQLWLLGLFLVVVLLVGAAAAYGRSRNLAEARNAAEERMALLAQVAADQVQEALIGARETTEAVAANPGLAPAFADPISPTCTLTFTGVGPFANGHLDIVDLDGTVRCSSEAPPGRSPYEGAAWLEEASVGATVIGPVDDPATGGPVVLVAAPVPDLGVVAAFLEYDTVETELAASLGGSRDERFSLIEDSSSSPQAGSITAEAQVPALGWVVRAAVDEDGALGAVERVHRQAAMSLIVAFLVLIAVTYAAYRGLARPIQRLSAAVRGARTRDETLPLDISGPAEVAALAEDFSALRREVVTELSRRRDAEAEARASEASYRSLFACHPLPMWVYDSETWAFLDVNDAAVARYGYSRDEFLAMSIRDIRPAEELPAFLESASTTTVMDRSGPWRHIKKDGTIIEVEITSHVVDFVDHRGRLVMAEDVTQRERTQRLLQQAERMESLGQLAGGIAHDFNNVLSVMLNYADFAAEEVAEAAQADPARWEHVRRDIEQVGVAGRRAAGLTQQLLSFARGQSADTGPVDLSEVARGIEDMLHRTLGDPIELELSLAQGLWSVEANSGQLEQVLVNLAVNARDAMPSGGKLSIETANVDVDEHHAERRPELRPGRYVRLRVSDTGVGMDAEARDRAFEPFFTTKQRGSGTGLGLATVYGIVSRAGGTLHVYSEPGLGTSISAMLPATDVRCDETDLPVAAARSTGHETILVVEDNDELRSLAERILTRDGYRVLTAADGAAALAVAAEHTGEIDMLLTDVAMPNMLGSELAVRLREIEPAMRVVFMSGYAPPLLLAGGTLPFGAPLVDKPFSADLLTDRVRATLDAPVSV